MSEARELLRALQKRLIRAAHDKQALHNDSPEKAHAIAVALAATSAAIEDVLAGVPVPTQDALPSYVWIEPLGQYSICMTDGKPPVLLDLNRLSADDVERIAEVCRLIAGRKRSPAA